MGCREYVPKARFVWDQGGAVPPYESWNDAAREIQSALDVSGSGDRIVVEAGTYGPIAVSNAVIVMGYRGAGETVIDAQGAERAVFLGGDYHLRAGSPCVDTGEVQDWMAFACDFDGQRRVESGEADDGRDIWVDIGTDEAVNDAVDMPTPGAQWWSWRVVMDARLQLQSTTGLPGPEWEDAAEPFTATEQTWTLDEPFTGHGKKFYRLIWKKGSE